MSVLCVRPENITLKCVGQVMNILFLLRRSGKQEEAQKDEACFEVHQKYDVVLEIQFNGKESSPFLHRTRV